MIDQQLPMSKPSEGKCGLTNMADWTDIGCSCYDFINDRSSDSLLKIIGLNYYYNDEKDNGWYTIVS